MCRLRNLCATVFSHFFALKHTVPIAPITNSNAPVINTLTFISTGVPAKVQVSKLQNLIASIKPPAIQTKSDNTQRTLKTSISLGYMRLFKYKYAYRYLWMTKQYLSFVN